MNKIWSAEEKWVIVNFMIALQDQLQIKKIKINHFLMRRKLSQRKETQAKWINIFKYISKSLCHLRSKVEIHNQKKRRKISDLLIKIYIKCKKLN